MMINVFKNIFSKKEVPAEELQEERAEIEIGQFRCHIIGELKKEDYEAIKHVNKKNEK